MTKFMIGADPEIFVKNAAGVNVSAHDIVPGSKKAPHKVAKGAVQPDGLAAEFNIDPVPYNDFAAFDENIFTVLSALQKTLPEGHKFDLRASTVFDKAYYDSLPESAKELGCDPDYCAYSEDPFEPNKRPDGASGLRSAAGHIHIGWGADIPVDHPDHIEICRKLIRNLDVYVGLGMTVFDRDTERRKLYGKAGAYRPKSYGVEYRTPSNAWLPKREYRLFIHGLVGRCLNDMSAGKDIASQLAGKYDIASIINDGDAKSAKMILTKSLGVTIPDSVDPEKVEAAAKKAAETARKATKKAEG